MKAYILYCLLAFWACTLQGQPTLQSWMDAGVLSPMKQNADRDLSAGMSDGAAHTYQKLISELRNQPGGCTLVLTGLREEEKQAVAGQLAAGTKQPVFRLSLPALGEKYIGETEKNLLTLFRTAESRNWILFFDEADALFGRQHKAGTPEATLQGMLLQGLKQFNGLAIVSLNQGTPPATLTSGLPCVKTPERGADR